jgi:formate hydrogenlyase subunit 6/NADH:ubiquinone oxidoreductase subunit I
MLYFVDTLRSLLVTMTNVLRPPTTVHFPSVRRPRPERYRASFALLHDATGDELCIGCKACERICPSEVISIDAEKRVSPSTNKKRSYAKAFVLDQNACIYCELCVQVCPTDAIVMTPAPPLPSYHRQSLCLDLARLYDNERTGVVSWATASKLAAMQSPTPQETTDAEPSEEGA